ncbi:MAG TPA: hypothetical protein VK007_07855 [Acidimicrobiales bacterium]|nr:hypothetical protein [Acidimicrobiales bacterium]
MTRTFLLWLHIASVAGWLGANYVQLVLAPRFAKASPEAAKAWARQTAWLVERYYNAIGALVAISGVLLVLDGPWSWHDRFIWVGIAVVVIGGALGGLAFGPLSRRQVAALEAGDASTAAEVQRRVTPLAVLDTALVLLAVWAMVDKWGL